MSDTMNNNKWKICIANVDDYNKWMQFASTVVNDFYNIDLPNDSNFCSVIMKNIKRGTALYVEEKGSIIGALVYSPNQNHIAWIAVHKDYRRRGVGTALVKYMFDQIPDRNEYKVKTFLDGEFQSVASHAFYKSFGFEPKEIIYEDMEKNANHPMQLFVKKRKSE
jgi:ribosomal protein S18 acetylase RimI-like enzyme